MSITCGIDWAEAHHDVALVDDVGATVAKKRIDTGLKGFSELMALIAEHGGEPDKVPVAVETDKNLIVVALMAAGFTVYPINPRAVARYRERHGQAGGKSDPGDAIVLAHILRTDCHHHRPMPAISETALAVKVLARQHQEAIWARQHTVNRLRSVLVEYYPNALTAFPNLTHRAALTILTAVPSPASAAQLTVKKTVALLRRCGRGDRAGLAEWIVHDLGAATLRQPPAVEQAFATATVGLVAIIATSETVIADLEAAMAAEFNRHPKPSCCAARPGWAPSWPPACSPKSATTRTDSQPPADCAPSPAPRRSPGPRGERKP